MTRDQLLICLKEAMPHVFRQQKHGKHEQDRLDASEWWEKWRELRLSVSDYGKEEGQ